MLKVSNIVVSIEDKEILKGCSLSINPGEIHALMGPNGSGKSTLAQSLMGHPKYQITSGEVYFESKNVLEMDPSERSLTGIFLSFQYPSEIEGVTVFSYLRMVYQKSHNTQISPVKFRSLLVEKMAVLEMKPEFMDRHLNEGFSGGEKKRMEMLQMLVLEPKLSILDEVDSGLDVDALKVVAKAVNYLHEKNNMSVLIITHYTRILKYIEVDYVHVMQNGVIVQSGDKKLAEELEEKGYSPYGE